MNIGTESDGRGEKALKTHTASTLTARLPQRGLIVIWPGVSGSQRHVVLFKLHHIITAFFHIKTHVMRKKRLFFLTYYTCVQQYVKLHKNTVFEARKVHYLCMLESRTK